MNFINVILIAIGLSIDACTVCTCNTLVYKPSKYFGLKLALSFGFFQFIMPLIGYYLINLIPFDIMEYTNIIAFITLVLISIKMLYDTINSSDSEDCSFSNISITTNIIIIQAISTSIDALSVGITYNYLNSETIIYISLFIGIITFVLSLLAVKLGKIIGTKLNKQAGYFGSFILLMIAVKILFGL